MDQVVDVVDDSATETVGDDAPGEEEIPAVEVVDEETGEEEEQAVAEVEGSAEVVDSDAEEGAPGDAGADAETTVESGSDEDPEQA